MPSDLTISLHIGVRDAPRAAYPVQIQYEGKPLAALIVNPPYAPATTRFMCLQATVLTAL
jgi:hypothetical protein